MMKRWTISFLIIWGFGMCLFGQGQHKLPPQAAQPVSTKVLDGKDRFVPALIPVVPTSNQERLGTPETSMKAGIRYEKARVLLPGMEEAEELTLKISNERVFLSDDIVLWTAAEYHLKKLEKGGIISYAISRWPEGQIPYLVPETHPSYAQIIAAIDYVNATTNICLIPRTTQPDYIEFVREEVDACWSYVGMLGGPQPINVDDCGVGSTVHEICHAAGMWHEQSRNDRDTYVTIHQDQIEAGFENNFEKYGAAGTDIGPYDYGSLMHYPTGAFSKNGAPTITVNVPPGSPSTIIGQRMGLSSGDVATLNGMYPTKNCGVVSSGPAISLSAPITVTPAPLVSGTAFSVATNFSNTGGSAFVGCYYVALFDQQDEFVQMLTSLQEVTGLPSGYTYTQNLTFNVGALSIPAGNYSIGIFYSVGCSSDYVLAGDGVFPSIVPITVVDPVVPVLSLSTEVLSFTGSGGVQAFQISSNTNWTISESLSWVSVSPVSGTNDGAVTVTVLPKTGSTSRSGSILVFGTGVNYKRLTINQTGSTTSLVVSPTALAVSAGGGIQGISIASNTDWVASESAEWLSLESGTGSGNGAFQVTVLPNLLTTSRTTSIGVSGTNADPKTVVVTQQGAPPVLTVSTSVLDFSAQGGVANLEIVANIAWKITGVPNWCSMSAISGTSNHTVALTCQANPDFMARTARIAIAASGVDTQWLVVNQARSIRLLELSPASLSFVSAGGVEVLSVATELDWQVVASEPWLTLTPSSGRKVGVVTVQCAENGSTSVRTAQLIATVPGAEPQVVTVTQAAALPFITPAHTTLNYAGVGGTLTTQIASNVSWRISESLTWVSVSPMGGTNNGQIRITVQPRTTIYPRTGTVTVYGGGVPAKRITISQAGVGQGVLLTTSPSTLNLDAAGETKLVAVYSNVGWTVSASAPWLVVSPTSGSGEEMLSIGSTQNFLPIPRTATVTVSEAGGLSSQVVVTQAGSNVEAMLAVDPASLSFNAAGGNENVQIASNTSWTLKGAATWIEVQPDSGILNRAVRIQCAPNPDITPRTTLLTLRGAGVAAQEMRISQEAAAPSLVVSPDTLRYSWTAGVQPLLVQSNTSWQVNTAADWLSLDNALGTGTDTIHLEAMVNLEPDSRVAELHLYSATGDIQRRVVVIQAGKPDVLLPAEWAVVPTDYNHTVVVLGDINAEIEGAPLEPGDYVGVFYVDKGATFCAGNGQWLGENMSFPVYGDNPTTSQKEGFVVGESFMLRVYRLSSQAEVSVRATYVPIGSNPLITAQGTYVQDGFSMISGLVTEVLDSQLISVTLGWNTLSSYVLPHPRAIEDFYTEGPAIIAQIQNGAGQVFRFNPPTNEISTWTITEGYRVESKLATILKVKGTLIDPSTTPIPFKAGWQIIPFFSRTDQGVATAMSSIRNQIIVLKDNAGKVYAPSLGLNSIRVMRPGQGYYLNARSSGTLTYPAGYLQGLRAGNDASIREVAEELPDYYEGVATTVTGSDATLILQAEGVASILSVGDEIGVYGSNNRLRAAAKYIGANQAIILRGDNPSMPGLQGFMEGEPYTFRVWKKALEQEFSFIPQRVTGGTTYEQNDILLVTGGVLTPYVEAPMAWHEGIHVFPNPASGRVSVTFDLPLSGAAQIRVLDVNGRELQRQQLLQGMDAAEGITFELTHYPAGIYVIQVVYAGERWNYKLPVIRD